MSDVPSAPGTAAFAALSNLAELLCQILLLLLLLQKSDVTGVKYVMFDHLFGVTDKTHDGAADCKLDVSVAA